MSFLRMLTLRRLQQTKALVAASKMKASSSAISGLQVLKMTKIGARQMKIMTKELCSYQSLLCPP